MRILFFIDLWDPRIGSSVRQMYQHAEGLRGQGHETAAISTTRDPKEVGWRTVEGMQVFLIYSDYPARFRAWKALNNQPVIRELRLALEEWRPDVVHSHLIHEHLSYESLREARRVGAGVVFTAHDSMTFCYQKLDCFHGGEEAQWEERNYKAHWSKCIPCQRFRYRPGRNAAIREVLAETVDRFTVVTDEQGAAIRANGIRVDRTVNNAICLQSTMPSEESLAAFRERFQLDGKLTLAIGGRLHELKGVVQVFQMLKLLREEFPEVRMLALGKEEIYESFQPKAKELGVDDLVISTGWLDGEELHSAIALTDVMLTPSICFETFGLMNLEAMEFGRPVVATSFGGCPEVISDGVNGFVANPYKVEEFAERIAQLLRDADLRAEMGAAGRERLEERFLVDRLTNELLEEYRAAFESAQGRAKSASAG